MKRAAILLLFALPAFAAEPSKFTLAQSGAAADPLTVLGPAVACADNVVLRNDTTTPNTLQCSAVTIADTTGAITGATSIIGGTGAADTLTLDGSAATAGYATITAGGALTLSSGSVTAFHGLFSGFIKAGTYLTLNNLAYLYPDAAEVIAQRNEAAAQTFRLYGTADVAGTFTNYARLSIAATDGTSTITTETAGTAADDQNLVVKGEGPTATLTLDGSDDVAGAVTVSAAGRIDAPGIFASAQLECSGCPIYTTGGGTIYSSGQFSVGDTATPISLEGSTPDGNDTVIAIADPTADRTITLPDATGTVALSSYGGMYETGGSTIIDVAAAGTYYPWVSATSGNVSGAGYVTFTNGTPDSLTIGANGAGVYLVNVALSYSGTANSTAICRVYQEGVAKTNCLLKRKLGTGGDVGNTGLTCLLPLVANDDISLYCTADGNGDDVTVNEANLTIARIGF